MQYQRFNFSDVLTWPLFAGLGVCAAILVPPTAAAEDEPADVRVEPTEPAAPTTAQKLIFTSLLTETSLRADDWVFVAKEKDASLAETWTIDRGDDEPVLICKGSPYGYLRTRRQFDDFVMELEWRFPVDENGNSGVLVYTSDEDKVWPKAMQVQLHQPLAGSIFASGDARSDNEIRDVHDVARPVNQWNLCRISSAGGTISVEINGKSIGEVTGCRPHKGWIALQSEGSEVHFRRIRIRETPPVAAPPAPRDSTTERVVPPTSSPDGSSVCDGDTRYGMCVGPCGTVMCRERTGKTSYVVYRNAVAADRAHHARRRRLRLDVVRTSAVVVGCGDDCLRRAHRRRDGL